VGYGAYRGVKYLGRKANEYAQEQERQRLFEAQQQMYAHQQLLASQRRELEDLAKYCQSQYNLALEKLSASDFGGALHTFNKLLPVLRQLGEPNGDLRSIYAGIHRFMGQAQLNLDDCQGAINSLNQSITYDSDNAESYALRAIARFQSNDQGGAKSDIAIAVSLVPSDSRYQSIQSEISQAGSRNTGTQEKEVLIRLHENTVNSVLAQFQAIGPEFLDVFSRVLGEEILLPVLVASQLYIVSYIEIQLL
jgi:tetratricopeptide (TPR) repeat protein